MPSVCVINTVWPSMAEWRMAAIVLILEQRGGDNYSSMHVIHDEGYLVCM